MKALRMSCAFLLMGIAVAISAGTIGAVFADEARAEAAVHVWRRVAVHAESQTQSIRLFSADGLPLQTLTPDGRGDAVTDLLEPSDYYAFTADGCTAFTMDEHGALSVSSGRGRTDGEILYLTSDDVGTVTLRGTVSAENVRGGWLDYVLTDGSYRRREVIYCEKAGETIEICFSCVPYGTYSLEESGLSVCELTLSAEHPEAEVVLP